MKRSAFGIILALFLLTGFSVFAGETSGTISLDSKYAWAENMGWVNFAPQSNGMYHGLVVNDSHINGFAWSAEYGWINFSPANSGQGVLNTGEGHLSGSAWVSGLGWLPMDGVVINSSGKFTGVAGTGGSTVGRINFDCNHCAVLTDWRPVSVRAVTPNPSPTNAISNGNKVVTSETKDSVVHDDVNHLNPLTSPPQNIFESKTEENKTRLTTLVIEPRQNDASLSATVFDSKKIHVEIPKGTFDRKVTITITPQMLSEKTAPSPEVEAFLIDGVIFEILAKDESGNPVHNLKKEITIIIDIPSSIKDEEDLGLYYLDESDQNNFHWNLLPNAVFGEKTVSVKVNHLTRFGIFKSKSHQSVLSAGLRNVSLKNNSSTFGLFLSVISTIVGGLILFYFYRQIFWKE